MPNSPENGSDFDLQSTLDQMSTAVKAAQILEKSRAEGIPMKDLVLINKGGKSKCVTQNEKAHIDEMRRKEIVQKLRQRNIRGDNSLSNDITARIQSCQIMVDYVALSKTMQNKDMLVIRRNLESTHNRAANLIKEVTVLETAIDRKKEADEVTMAFEKASSELMVAIQERDLPRINQLREFCEKNMATYNLRQKRLKPYLAQCRQARIKFITEKRTIMRMQFQVYSQVIEIIAQEHLQGKFAGFNPETIQFITKSVNQVRRYRQQGHNPIELLAQPLRTTTPADMAEIENELDKIDEDFLSTMAQEMTDLIEMLKSTLAAVTEMKPISEEESKRMAYQEKEEINS